MRKDNRTKAQAIMGYPAISNTEEGTADAMAEAAIYYFKILDSAPEKPEVDYYRVRAKAKDLLRIAVEKYLENKRK